MANDKTNQQKPRSRAKKSTKRDKALTCQTCGRSGWRDQQDLRAHQQTNKQCLLIRNHRHIAREFPGIPEEVNEAVRRDIENDLRLQQDIYFTPETQSEVGEDNPQDVFLLKHFLYYLLISLFALWSFYSIVVCLFTKKNHFVGIKEETYHVSPDDDDDFPF